MNHILFSLLNILLICFLYLLAAQDDFLQRSSVTLLVLGISSRKIILFFPGKRGIPFWGN